MTTDTDPRHELMCHIKRSVRYHRARQRFFDGWSHAVSFVSLLAGSAVVVALLASAPTWVAVSAGAAVAAIQALEQVARAIGSPDKPVPFTWWQWWFAHYIPGDRAGQHR